MPRANFAGATVVVLGLGRFGGGLGVARWLAAQDARVIVTDRLGRADLAAPAAELEALGVELRLGGHGEVDPGLADLLVVNPAVPLDAPLVRRARAAGVEVTSEIALLLERWPGPLLGVTGSNGKSTTAGLCQALLAAAGRPSVLGGNIGGSLLSRLDGVDRDTIAVLELSSFMLELLGPRRLGPDVAVITNLSPNHLDRHGTFAAYRRAKQAILVAAHTAVLPAALDELARGRCDRSLRFGDPGGDVDLAVDADGNLRERDGTLLLASSAVPLPGRMNRLNLAAAVLAVGAVLQEGAQVRAALPRALADFRPLPHRLELVAERGGVRWVDDSVSTCPESTAASLEAVGGPCLLIAGGRDKGLDPEPLLAAAAARAVRLVLTVGEQATSLVHALRCRGVAAEQVQGIPAAVSRAAEQARPGETVLLSPGYSSQDQFVNYQDRAESFVRAVARLEAAETLSRPTGEC